MSKLVIHVDDRYRQKSDAFKVLREFLEGHGFKFHGIAEFDATSSKYQHLGYPEIVIMDILDKSPDGNYTAPGVKIAEDLEQEFQAGFQSPCIIFYTGIPDENHRAIQQIRNCNPYTPIVRKTIRVADDAEKIYNHFPERLKNQA